MRDRGPASAPAGAASRFGCVRERERAAVELAAGRGREAVHGDVAHRAHPGRELALAGAAQGRQQRLEGDLGHRVDPRHQLAACRAQVAGVDHRFPDAALAAQHGFDLGGLDPVAVELDLVVDPAPAHQQPGGVAGDLVPGGIPAPAVGIREALGRECRPSQVAVGERAATDEQLALLAGHGLDVASRGPQPQPHVGQRPADRHQCRPGVGGPLQPVAGHHVRFGRPVVVVQRHAREPLAQVGDGGRDLQLLTGADDVAQRGRGCPTAASASSCKAT